MTDKKTKNKNNEKLDIEDKAVLGKGNLNPKRTRPVVGEIGTDADVYENSGMDDIPETTGADEGLDEEDDTRLGGV